MAYADSHIVKFITKVDQLIKDVVSEETSKLIKIIKQINILEPSYIKAFLINLTESQIANLIDFIERNKKDLEKLILYCDLRLMRACLTNNTEQFKDTLKELQSNFYLTADRLEPYIIIL